MSGYARVIKQYAKSSNLDYSRDDGDDEEQQTDFRPEVKRLCEEYKGGASKNIYHSITRSAKVIIIGAPGIGKTSLVLSSLAPRLITAFSVLQAMKSWGKSGDEVMCAAGFPLLPMTGMRLSARYCRDMFERNYKTTIGVDFEVEKFQILGVPFNMQIWDTAGAERFKGVTTAYFRGAEVVVLAYDLSDEETLHKTREWLMEAQEYCCSNFQVFLVACKKDLVTVDYDRREAMASDFAKKYSAEFWCTSSRTAEDVDALFTRIATTAFESVILREVEIATSSQRNGQLAQNSTLIRVRPPPTKQKMKQLPCCHR